MKNSEDKQFEQYRRTGSTKALSRVFEAVAPELFRVAWYLSAGDQHRTEDALQATFLTAIEDRCRWDSTRRLRPWLLGILANHVRKDERRSRRAGGKEALHNAIPEPETLSGAEAAEVRGHVLDALRELTPPYREVMILHLEHGLSANKIAETLSRKPGTVRTQLVRGLEIVRKLLPAGIATGAVLSLPSAALAQEVIGRIHSAVLEHASRVSDFPLSSTLNPTLRVYQSRFAAMMLCLLPVFLTTWALWPATKDQPITALVGAVTSKTSIADSPIRPRIEREAVSEVRNDDSPRVQTSYKIKVLVENAEGAVLPGENVMLLIHGEVRYALANTAGKATFDYGTGLASYQVGVVGHHATDFAPPLFTPASREHKLVIEPGLDLDIQVLDSRGHPLANAYVEGALGTQWQRTYNPLGQTGPDGVLHLHDVDTRGQIKAYAHGHQATRFVNFRGKTGDKISLTLRSRGKGLTATGIVVDEKGKSLPHAQLAVVQFGGSSPVEQYLASDDEGGFSLDWLYNGRHLVTGLAHDHEQPLRGLLHFEHTGSGTPELRLILRKNQTVRGKVIDAQGSPVPLATVSTRYVPDAVYKIPYVAVSTKSGPDGSFELKGVLPGPNQLRAHGDSVDVEALETIPEAGTFEWLPRPTIRQAITIHLVDERSEPLAGWRVGLTTLEGFNRGATMTTDEDGMVGRREGMDWLVGNEERRRVEVYAPAPDDSDDHGLSDQWLFPVLVSPPITSSPKAYKIVVPRDARLNSSITGRFLSSDGTAAEGGQLVLSSTRAASYNSMEVWADKETGRFNIGPLSKGRYKLAFLIKGRTKLTRTFKVASGRVLEVGGIRMPEVGTVTVHASYVEGGIPPRGDQIGVRLEAADGTQWTAYRQKDGSYRARGVHRGDLTLIYWGNHTASRRLPITLASERLKTAIKLKRDAIVTAVHVLLPPGQQRNQQGWSGKITVRDANTGRLLLRVKRNHDFLGLFQDRLPFTLPLSRGEMRITVESWDKMRATVDVMVPSTGPVEVLLPLRRN